MLDSASLERLVPDELASKDTTSLESLALHVERYEFAARNLPPGRLLDAGCGVGYGTRLLVERGGVATSALGIDVEPQAIAYARERYGSERVDFRADDLLLFEDRTGFDGVVALEIVEHVDNPKALIDHLLSMLRPGGVLVASVPTTPSTDLNPYHRHDFTERSFRRLFNQSMVLELDLLRQRQGVRIGRLLRRRDARLRDVRRGLAFFYLHHPVALLRRLRAFAVHGCANCYTTIAWEKIR
jgi:2-polyprenyl-3-methyl-5-hydroxy-6-metoxy-1,4-benzoquinol methylase